ncbi:DHHC-type zinc finger domain-containing protein [Encephalitozoon intestinalis ATCC 50506]|uniref:Palmitoyltransferase n=1 Tax=Encephalitozoon intestinalis (strain ATCC 50506) TaxID=876142 RepID=E0S8D6_ENCIT|nr:DHHC-type zinc finger domain-containing protein [Encephalitozoon intestinalis ATCC 50506]ADM12073.1 DHHC-type zinc finger domain-containing protein [Encephalitozoon intestinalis ATCC 50506]UTX45864.1 palmitoyltransferase [Encephalitozoon intestinalis]
MSIKAHESCSDQLRTRFVMFLHIKMYIGTLMYCLLLVKTFYGSLCLVLLVVANSLSFLKACLNDPGRVNKKTYHKYLPDVVAFEKNISTQICTNKNGDWIRAIRINGTEYEEKYCLECNLFRIGGMSHCRECNRCILDMDHHCLWFGNCIGRNNIRHFHIYLYTLVAVILVNAALLYSLIAIYPWRNTPPGLALKTFLFLLAVLYTLFFCVIFLFTAFNIYVALNSSTSKDFIKNGLKNKRFDLKRACRNLSRIRPEMSSSQPSV